MQKYKTFIVSIIFSVFLFNFVTAHASPELENGIIQYQRENYDEALGLLKKAETAEPQSTRVAYYMGLTQKKLQNYKEARIHLEKAVTGSPKIREALLELIEVLYQLNDTAEAARWIAAAEEQGMRPGETAFVKGLVQLKEDKSAEAVESFQKAKELQPALKQAADYQIGLAHLKGRSFDAAREAFKEVILLDPNTDIARFADEYSKAIDRRVDGDKALRITAAAYFEYDDNVVLKPSDSASVQDIGNESDRREVVTASVELGKKTSDRFGFRAQYDLYFANQHDLDAFDLHSHTFSGIPSFYFGDHVFSAPVQYNFTVVDDDKYLETTGVNPIFNLRTGERHLTQLGLKVQVKTFQREPVTVDENRDATRWAPSAGWFYFFSEQGFFAFRYEYDSERADGRNWSFDGHRVNATVQIPFSARFRATFVGDAYLQDYDSLHSVFNVNREDETYTLSAMLSYQLYKEVDLQLRYTYVRHESNIPIYDYDRNVYSAGVLCKF